MGWRKDTHSSLSVSNLEKAIAFYRDQMGMHVSLNRPTPRIPDPDMDKCVGVKEASFKVAQLEYDGNYVLELLEWVSPKPKPFPKNMKVNDLGFHWQCIYHTDVDGIYKKLKTSGVKSVSEPIKLSGGKVTSVFCFDPDGNWVEIHSPRKESTGTWLKDTHTTISVSNVEKAIAFYRDQLGMKVRLQPYLYQPDPDMDKITGLKKASFWVAQLDYDDAYVLEILQWVSPTPKPFPTNMKINDLGFHWQCIYHTDVNGIYKQLKAAGVKFVSEPIMLSGGKVTSVFCLDPDGNMVEIHSPRVPL